MKIDTYILCFNEEKMIRHALNHYSSISDSITIFDNDSTDNSLLLIKNYFPNVKIERFDTGGQYREDIQIWIRNNCWKNSNADLVIVCDMDEFLYDKDLTFKLQLLIERKVAIPVVYGYNMVSNTYPTDYESPIFEQVKIGFRDRWFDKSIIFNPHLMKEINFGPGSHFCEPILHVEGRQDLLIELKLLHYKYLDKEYLFERHNSYATRMSEVNKKFGYGNEYLMGMKHIEDRFSSASKYLFNVLQ